MKVIPRRIPSLFLSILLALVLVAIGFTLVGTYTTGVAAAPLIVETNEDTGSEGGYASLKTDLGESNSSFVPDRIIVKLGVNSKLSSFSSGSGENFGYLEQKLASMNVKSLKPLFPSQRIASNLATSDLSQIYIIELLPGSDVLQVVNEFVGNFDVEWAEPDYYAYAATTPNDTYFPEQWALTQINAPAAWDIVTGTANTVIAVLDTGIDLDHPDLVNRIWMNPGETPGNGIDDDNNGFIDDINGWNFIASTNEVGDDDGHGTEVAGVSVAETDNASGIAGVCWNCRLMSVKVMQAGGVANYSDVALGVYYAAAKGAEVINISLGGYADSNALEAAIEAATDTSVIVAAAGDSNTSAPFYPAAYPEVIAVGGTTVGDTRTATSNYGDWVDVAAPAENITTTQNGGWYGPESGTSMASSLVSGLAGLVQSQHPTWSPDLVRGQIIHTAETLGSSGLGYGRINAELAVSQAPQPLFMVKSISVNDDPLGRPTPGDAVALKIVVDNSWLEAEGVIGVLTTTDPGITITVGTSGFGDIASGSGSTSNPAYSFTVSSSIGYNHPIPFTLNLVANTGEYTATLPLTVTTRSASEPVAGTLVADTTWTSDKTYIVNSNVGVAPGVTLTIQAGTVVKFNGNYNLNVGGTLIARGTESEWVRFMSNTGSEWGRIYFDDSAVDATADVTGTYQTGNILEWVQIEAASQGIGCNNATPYLSQVNLLGGGVSCTLGGTNLWMQDSNLEGDVTVNGGGQAWRNSITGGSLSFSGQATVRENEVQLDINIGSASLVQDNAISWGSIDAPGASTVQGNQVTGGGITVGDNANVIENQVAGDDISAGNSSLVLTNTLYAGGIVIGNGSMVRENDIEEADGWGISATGDVTVSRNRVVGCENGLQATGGLVQSNLIANSTVRGLQVSNEAEVFSNTITGNMGNALVVVAGSPLIQGNNLEGNRGNFDLVNNTANPITATLNWWGITDSLLIDGRIYDFFDDFTLGQVSYISVLTGPVQDAPAYIRSVTLDPESPVGIETVTFEVEFSRPMEPSIQPGIEFYSSTRGEYVNYWPVGVDFPRTGDITVDRQGTVWATLEEWLVEITPDGTWIYHNVSGYGDLETIAIDSYGNRWYGSLADELCNYAVDGSITCYPSPTENFNALGIDQYNNKWVSSCYDTSYYLKNCHINYFDQFNNWITPTLPTFLGDIGTIHFSADGTGWFGGREGLFRYSTDGEWQQILGAPNELLAIWTDTNERIWVGNFDGAYYLNEHGTWDMIWATPGSPGGADAVNGIAVDHIGNVWVGEGCPGNSCGETEGIWLKRGAIEYQVEDNQNWGGFNTIYRASYDINGQIPRGVYSITVSGSLYPAGVEIAPNSAHTLEIDYIGTPETNTPPEPVVRACAADTNDTLTAEWSVPTIQTIGLYRYAIGTEPGLNDVTNWVTTTLTLINRNNLNLLEGQTYYVNVKARNTGGIWSDTGSSNGVVAGAGGCPDVDFISNPVLGMSPLAVTFTAQTTETVEYFEWAFGDGFTSTLENPSHVYWPPDIYTITLDAYGPSGWTTVSKPGYITVTPDTVPPTGTLVINGGATVATQITVTLQITANDPSGVSDIRFSNDNVSYSDWISYSQNTLWMLSIGDGPKTVYAQVRDNPGNIVTISDDIALDQDPPTTTAQPSGVTGNNGWWQSPVTVTLSASDAGIGVAYSEYRVDGTSIISYTMPIVISTDGTHALEYWSVDGIGHREITQTLEIKVDTVLPTTTIVLSGTQLGGWYTTDILVTLSAFDSVSGIDEIHYRLDGGAWQIYTGTFSITEDGIHTLEFQSTDNAGNQDAIQLVTIRRDTTAPQASVNELTPYQPTLDYMVSWQGDDQYAGIASFDIQIRDGDGEWVDWITNTTALSATFSGLDGHRFHFRARARDVLGHQGEFAVGDGDTSTRVDTTRPEEQVLINGGALETTGRDVQLVLLANGASQVAFSDDGVNFSPWEAFPSTYEVRPYQLPAGDGSKTVYVRFVDFYGQIVEYSDTIFLNTSLIGDVGVSINNDAPTTEDITVTLTIKAPPDTQFMKISNSSRFVAAEWEPYSTSQTWALAYHPDVDVYQVYVKFRNVNGTVSERYDDIITLNLLEPPPPLDNIPPNGNLSINAGAKTTSAISVTLDVLASDDPGGLGVEWVYFREWEFDPVTIQWVATQSSGWLPYADTFHWNLNEGTGVKYIGAWFADGAYNVSNPVILDSINLVLPGENMNQADVAQHRQTFEPGEVITVTLDVLSGDADLYIWRPGGTVSPDYWSNQAGSLTERLVFTAIDGEYLIEVHGYTNATFELYITSSKSPVEQVSTSSYRLSETVVDTGKSLPAHPLVTNKPGDVSPEFQPPDYQLYLPIIINISWAGMSQGIIPAYQMSILTCGVETHQNPFDFSLRIDAERPGNRVSYLGMLKSIEQNASKTASPSPET